jgi:integrase
MGVYNTRIFVKKEPKVLLQNAKRSAKGREELEFALRRYYSHLRESGLAKSSAAQWYAVIRSYFTRNYVSLPRISRDMMIQSTYEDPNFVLSHDQVKQMVQSRDSVGDKLVIAFLAQTGQRIGVLTALKRKMIETRPANRWHGLVEVFENLENPKGRNVNKYEVHYKFVIGEDTMKLIDEMPKYEGGWLFDISKRQMARIVNDAATDIGLQQDKPTRLRGRSHYAVHPHVFRRYWVNQVTDKGINPDGAMDTQQREYMMSHRLEHGGTYARGLLADDKLIEAYKRVEPNLKVTP